MDFSEIKAVLQQYSRASIVKLVLSKLNQIQLQKNLRYPVWKLLTLIKWSYVYTDDDYRRKNISYQELNDLEKLVEQFETEFDGLNFKTHKAVKQSFRIIAYQQFCLQEEFINADIDRQIVLYRQLTSSFDMEAEFKKQTKMELFAFINYCYFTYLYLNMSRLNKKFGYEGVLGEDYKGYFCKQFTAGQMKEFLFLLSAKGSPDFESLHKLNDERLQLFETNFFLTRPFIRFKGEHYIPYRAVFNQTIKHFVYTYMKAALPDGFPEEFGKRMERYVELGLKELKIDYQTENEIKKLYKVKKVADYWIKPNILLECKATELHPRSGVMRLPNMLTRELDSSVIKAYRQLLSTANAINPGITWWGIIITYREMYLGFGQDAWDEFMQEEMEQFAMENNIAISILPPENLFFIPVDDWDYMVQVVKEGKGTFEDILAKGRELNQVDDPVQRVFLMNQVLTKHFGIDIFNLTYLQEAHKTIDVYSQV